MVREINEFLRYEAPEETWDVIDTIIKTITPYKEGIEALLICKYAVTKSSSSNHTYIINDDYKSSFGLLVSGDNNPKLTEIIDDLEETYNLCFDYEYNDMLENHKILHIF